MIARLSLAAVLGFALLSVIGAAEPPAPPAASVREAVYFGPAGPVRIRLNLSINGRPADTVWAEAIGRVFAFRDQNEDGLLDPTERAVFAPPTRRITQFKLFPDGRVAQPLQLAFTQKEKITRTAFADAVRAANFGAIGLQLVPGRADSQQLSAALFRHLDQDGDGRLSTDELKAVRERLAFLDIDEDEFFTAAELLGRGAGPNTGPVRQASPSTRPAAEPADPSKDLVFLTEEGPAAVKQLLAARGKGRATSLRPAEFGSDAKTFAALDQDGNGVLDSTELAAWFRRPPDLDLTVSFDAEGGRVSTLRPALNLAEKKSAVAVELPGGRFHFEAPDSASRSKWGRAAAVLREQFNGLTKDSGFAERKPLENQPLALAFFDFADRKGLGKIDAAEVEAAMKALTPLSRCRIDVTFTNVGNGLFELLDRNGDGRLSPRELVESIAALKPFAGRDGSVGPKDLVRRFRVHFTAEPIPVGVLIPPPQPLSPNLTKPPSTDPDWFTKMDRNGDGDVSLREFVGPIELFRKLDRDGDGLISPAKRAADK